MRLARKALLKTSDELAREAEEGAEARELSHPSRMLEAHTSRMLVDVWPSSDEGLV